MEFTVFLAAKPVVEMTKKTVGLWTHDRFYNTIYTKGNPDLDLEKVRNLSFGLTWNPTEVLGLPSTSGLLML